MRDNGLVAQAYTSMGEIDAALTGSVLDSLAVAGIAAYAESPATESPDTESRDPEAPSPGAPAPESPGSESSGTESPGPGGTAPGPAGASGALRRPGRPTERVYVDASETELARAVIRRSTEEAQWRSLVEQFNEPAAEPGAAAGPAVPRWPAAEDLDESDAESPDGPGDGSDRGTDPGVPSPALHVEEGSGADRPVRDPHDHYLPPEPAPGPRLDWISRLAWLGVLGGPVLLIVAALLDVGGSSRITLAALTGFAGGFLTLVIRMKDRPNVDDTPDDGAVV